MSPGTVGRTTPGAVGICGPLRFGPFFAVGGLLTYLHYLKYGLSVILMFVGVKMLVSSWSPIPVETSFSVIGGILLVAVIASMVRSRLLGPPPAAEAGEPPRAASEGRHE